MTMLLGRLLTELKPPQEAARIRVTGVAVDSRLVKPGDVFFAIPGNAADGVFHVVKQAIHAGCRLIEVVHRGANIFECHNQRFDRAAALIGKFDAFTDGVNIAQ